MASVEVPQDVSRRDSDPDSGASAEQRTLANQPISNTISRDQLLNEELFPSDSYENGIYFGDLPFAERVKWVNRQNNAETKRELGVIWGMFKKDPISPVNYYMSNYAVKGMGLFVEGWTLFSIGNLTPLFKAVWPECWKNYTVCNERTVNAIDYLEIVGIIIGQILVGFEGDWIGRKWGMVQDALIMTLGTVLLVCSWGPSLQGWIWMYGWSLFIYGIGVGGEYPMTATSSMEGGGSGRAASTGDKLHRGRKVSLAFLMQGWGQFGNQVALLLLLLIFHGGGNPPYSTSSAQYTFRVQFAFVGCITLWLAYRRYYHMSYDANKDLQKSKKKAGVTGYDRASLKLSMNHYWHRLIGTAGTWFCNDFFFYGNKIFQSTFISVITGGSPSVIVGWNYSLINIGVSLVGYYFAAFFIDHKFYGRKRMQAVGFIADFILFIVAAALYNTLIKPGPAIHVFQFIYFFSSFWNQFGPNSTTFLLAAEVYPAAIRASSHGVSAAIGKVGALLPAIIYNYVDNHTKFWIVSWFGLVGFILTMVFIPDTTGMDLREQERYWEYVRAGRASEYHGIAIHPRHLSWFEHAILKRSRNYDAELDRQAKVAELKSLYERSKDTTGEEEIDDDVSSLSSSVKQYFGGEKDDGGITDVKAQ